MAPKNQTKLIGENVSFTCEFLPDLHVYIQWVKYPMYIVETLDPENITFTKVDKYVVKVHFFWFWIIFAHYIPFYLN